MYGVEIVMPMKLRLLFANWQAKNDKTIKLIGETEEQLTTSTNVHAGMVLAEGGNNIHRMPNFVLAGGSHVGGVLFQHP